MDELFVTNVPDLTKWGTLSGIPVNDPRPYHCHTLEITISPGAPNYDDVVCEVARSIACARLNNHYLMLWDEATTNRTPLAGEDQFVLIQALSRGICSPGTRNLGEIPPCNDDHFKGHLVEVLLYCMRAYLAKSGEAHPCIFEPPYPKAISASPGIDLLEVGGIDDELYFQVWECKGTDGDARAALRDAADQLCVSNGTAYQGFMQAYRCLQTNDSVVRDSPLFQFINRMPRMFFQVPAHDSKRFGGAVGFNTDDSSSPANSFATKVNNAVGPSRKHCQVVLFKIANFPQFRKDVFQQLWSIF